MTDIPIIYEDDAVVAIDKPSGIAVNRSENEKGDTIQDWTLLRQGFGGQAENKGESDFVNRAGIVHRLDKDTSGILIIAKSEAGFVNLQKQFFERSVDKSYIALVHGKIDQNHFTINAPVGRLPWNRRKFGVLPEGREAITDVTVVSVLKNNRDEFFTLIEAQPKTGRTHQIRIHLKHFGHSIVSDPLYAGRNVLNADLMSFPRLFLHAAKISFNHPVSGIRMNLECELPGDLKNSLKIFDKN